MYKYVGGTRGSLPKYGNQNLYSCDRPNHLSHKDFKTKREKEFICNSFTFSYVIYLSMTYLNKCPKNRGFIEYSPLSSCMDKSLSPLPSPSNQSLDRILASLEIAHVLPSSPTMSDSKGWSTNWQCQYPSMYQQHTHSISLVFSYELYFELLTAI